MATPLLCLASPCVSAAPPLPARLPVSPAEAKLIVLATALPRRSLPLLGLPACPRPPSSQGGSLPLSVWVPVSLLSLSLPVPSFSFSSFSHSFRRPLFLSRLLQMDPDLPPSLLGWRFARVPDPIVRPAPEVPARDPHAPTLHTPTPAPESCEVCLCSWEPHGNTSITDDLGLRGPSRPPADT